jgi:hypothetical protein
LPIDFTAASACSAHPSWRCGGEIMAEKPAADASSNWLLIVEDVFPRWRDRLGSSHEAVDEL